MCIRDSKYHRVAKITCALKNIFGAISTPRKYAYHPRLSEVIVGINKIVKSNIVVVDGIIALGKYPKKMGLIMTGDDALAVDFVAAEIMGYKPTSVPHLRLAAKEKIGETKDINLIQINVKLKEIKHEFPKQYHGLQRLLWGMQLKMLRLYAKIVKDVIPPVLEE